MPETTHPLAHANDPAPVRFLDDAGNWDPSDTAAAFAAELEDLDLDTVRGWYRDMVATRAFDTECTHLQRQGQLALWVPSVGQEGCQVGLAHALERDDHVFPAYREHLVARVRGVPFADVAKLFRGLTHGGWDVTDPANGNFHLYTLVLGAQTHHATGYALGQLLDAKRVQGSTSMEPGEPGTAAGQATMVFYGDGTTSQGDANEALIFAASYQTPQVFVVQNNHWAISVPVTRQTRTPIYRRALGFGIPGVQIDGNDALAAYAVGRRMLRDAREGRGPGFIEALTYRIGAHTTSDDPTRYREAEELEHWQQRDPIDRLAGYLRARGVTEEFFEQVQADAASDAGRVRDEILRLPLPDTDAVFAHVYAEPHPRIDEQRNWFERYEASFEEGGDDRA